MTGAAITCAVFGVTDDQSVQMLRTKQGVQQVVEIMIEISSYFLKFRLHMNSHAGSWSEVHRPTARRGEFHNLYGNFGRF